MKVFDGETFIGRTGAGGCLSWERESGQTVIIGKAQNISRLPLKMQKNTVYYVKQKVLPGFFWANNRLLLLSDKDGKKLSEKCGR